LLQGDLFSALHGERYDLIIANPPYVAAGVMRRLPREYRYEPQLALAAGSDGLDAVRVILRQAAGHLTAAGLLVVEVGHNRKRLEAVFPHLPFVWLPTSGGDDCVFMLECRDLASAAGTAAAALRQASRPGASSRRRSTRDIGRV
jgi:ribosomal protein L3 glutamine methyltransferase